MVLFEAATYTLTGCIAGSVLGIMLHKALIENLMSPLHVVWKFPLVQVVIILVVTISATVFSVIGPLQRIKAKGISEVVNAL